MQISGIFRQFSSNSCTVFSTHDAPAHAKTFVELVAVCPWSVTSVRSVSCFGFAAAVADCRVLTAECRFPVLLLLLRFSFGASWLRGFEASVSLAASS